MNLVFAGTPDFAARILECILRDGHRMLAVYTQPDRPAGRGRKRTPGPVKQLALHHGLAVRQPRSLRDEREVEALAALAPDVMVVAAYGLMLPPPVLETPRLGCINVHASLLPRWRGAAPIQRAILAGDHESGVCIMRMEKGLDTGPVLARRRCRIASHETAGTLHDTLARLGCIALMETLEALSRGDAVAEPQDDSLATYARRIDKAETRLDWSQDAWSLERRVRAFNPAPMAWTLLPAPGSAREASRLKVIHARAENCAPADSPGEVVEASRDGVLVACSRGCLRLLEVQPAGRKPMKVRELLNSRPLAPGDRFS